VKAVSYVDLFCLILAGDKDEAMCSKNGKKAKDAKEPKEGSTPLIPAKTSKRLYSIVIWGATGFTGSLLCKEIANVYPVRSPRRTEWTT
jgi:hypothetical protein